MLKKPLLNAATRAIGGSAWWRACSSAPRSRVTHNMRGSFDQLGGTADAVKLAAELAVRLAGYLATGVLDSGAVRASCMTCCCAATDHAR